MLASVSAEGVKKKKKGQWETHSTRHGEEADPTNDELESTETIGLMLSPKLQVNDSIQRRGCPFFNEQTQPSKAILTRSALL